MISKLFDHFLQSWQYRADFWAKFLIFYGLHSSTTYYAPDKQMILVWRVGDYKKSNKSYCRKRHIYHHFIWKHFSADENMICACWVRPNHAQIFPTMYYNQKTIGEQKKGALESWIPQGTYQKNYVKMNNFSIVFNHFSKTTRWCVHHFLYNVICYTLLKVFKLFGGGNLYRGHIILLTHLRDSNIETSTTLNEILIFIGFPFDIKYFNFFCRLHTTGNWWSWTFSAFHWVLLVVHH